MCLMDVNGAFGTIAKIVHAKQGNEDHDENFPTSIHVAFDDPKVGQKHAALTLKGE